MSNPSGPDEPSGGDEATDEVPSGGDEEAPEAAETGPGQVEHEPATEVMSTTEPAPEESEQEEPERRFTAPSGFDDGSTQQITTTEEPATEVMSVPTAPAAVAQAMPTESFGAQKPVAPQVIPPRGDSPQPPSSRRRWGWLIAVVLVIAALIAVAVLGTVLLTQAREPKVSQEDMVRATIKEFDIAIQKGDLAKLRSITCGATRDSYVKYDDRSWAETHERVAAAKQYPVVASVDQVVVNGDHAEANVTTFMAYAPQTRSTRSFDLQFLDEQWKVCLAPQ